MKEEFFAEVVCPELGEREKVRAMRGTHKHHDESVNETISQISLKRLWTIFDPILGRC